VIEFVVSAVVPVVLMFIVAYLFILYGPGLRDTGI
jgi:cbb3-type cytochrome oxidase subunit 3